MLSTIFEQESYKLVVGVQNLYDVQEQGDELNAVY